jgi:hypothetical protein
MRKKLQTVLLVLIGLFILFQSNTVVYAADNEEEEEEEEVTIQSQMEDAQDISYDEQYNFSIDADSEKWLSFTTDEYGAYVLKIDGYWEYAHDLGRFSLSVDLYDQYNRGQHYDIFSGKQEDKAYTISEKLIPYSTLEPNTRYFIKLKTDANEDKTLNFALSIEHIKYSAPKNVKLSYDENQNIVISWSNVNEANTYNSLSSYDEFDLEMSTSSDFSEDYIVVVGDGSVVSHSCNSIESASNYFRLTAYQKIYYDEDSEAYTYIYAESKVLKPEKITKDKTYTVNKIKYKVTKNKTDGTGEVAVVGATKKSGKLTIGNTVRIRGKKFNITSIADNAFKNSKFTSVTLGGYIKKIGTKAFYGSKNLKKVTFGSNINKIGTNAFSKVNSKIVYKVPSDKKKAYTKLLKKSMNTKKSVTLNIKTI